MATKPKTEAAPAAADNTESASANVNEGALSQMLSKGRASRRASSDSAKQSDETPAPVTASEHTTAGDGADPDDSKTSLETAAEQPPVDTTEGGAEATAEGDETAGGDDAEGAEKAEKPSKAIREMQKRIDKLTAKLAAAEERAEESARAAAQQAKAEQQSGAKPSPHPLDDHFTRDSEVQAMDGQLAGLDAFTAWAEENPGGGTWTENGKTYELSEQDVRQYRQQSQREARRLESRREARLESLRTSYRSARESAHAQAVKLYPWIEQKSSAEFQEAVTILRENPALMQRPDFEMVVARMVAGERLERETLRKLKPGAAKRPASSSTPAPVVAHTPNAAPKVDAARKAAGAAESKFKETGRVGDLATMLAQRRQQRLDAAHAA